MNDRKKNNGRHTELRSLVVEALKPFIGDSRTDVRNYWTGVGISDELISEGRYSDTKESYLILMSGIVGRPEFEATFKNDLCTGQTVSVSAEDVSECMDAIRRQGFSYSSRLKRWSKAGEIYVWRIEEHHGDNLSLIARRVKNRKSIDSRFSTQLTNN